jgi:hypothetical protein
MASVTQVTTGIYYIQPQYVGLLPSAGVTVTTITSAFTPLVTNRLKNDLAQFNLDVSGWQVQNGVIDLVAHLRYLLIIKS